MLVESRSLPALRNSPKRHNPHLIHRPPSIHARANPTRLHHLTSYHQLRAVLGACHQRSIRTGEWYNAFDALHHTDAMDDGAAYLQKWWWCKKLAYLGQLGGSSDCSRLSAMSGYFSIMTAPCPTCTTWRANSASRAVRQSAPPPYRHRGSLALAVDIVWFLLNLLRTFFLGFLLGLNFSETLPLFSLILYQLYSLQAVLF